MPASRVERERVKKWLRTCGDLDETFQRLDVNGDGSISKAELQQIAHTGEIHHSMISAILAVGDTSRSGKISLHEFSRLGETLLQVDELKVGLGLCVPATEEGEVCLQI